MTDALEKAADELCFRSASRFCKDHHGCDAARSCQRRRTDESVVDDARAAIIAFLRAWADIPATQGGCLSQITAKEALDTAARLADDGRG